MTTEARDLVGQHFPYDGPHTDDRTRQAAEAVADLTRYLANATRGAEAVTEPATIAATLGDLTLAVSRLDQIAGQLRDRLTAFQDVQDDRPGTDPAAGIRSTIDALRDVQLSVAALTEDLSHAHQAASHLY